MERFSFMLISKPLSLMFFAVWVIVGCAGPADETVKNEQTGSAAIDAETDSFQLNGGPVVKVPGKVYLACFYGKNDHGNVAKKKCDEMLKDCKARYGSSKCEILRNPDKDDLEKIGSKGIIIMIGHSTPNNMSPDQPVNPQCRHDIWDTGVTPKDINNCGLPVVWYGCYGSGVSKECNRVIPLQDHPKILDSRDPEIACRFKATMLCYEILSKQGKAIDPAKIDQCLPSTMQQLKASNDAHCR